MIKTFNENQYEQFYYMFLSSPSEKFQQLLELILFD